VRFVIVGIGINVNQEKFPAELSAIATSIRKESGRMTYRLELLARLLGQFESDYNRFLRDGPGFVVERFQGVSSFAEGRRVRVDTGVESYVGTTAGLSLEGLLLVTKDNGPLVTVIAGDVTEVR
jgi:BirA family biotin operon repressor/biotin-[acetyl-CoA-carboxylase] ligase